MLSSSLCVFGGHSVVGTGGTNFESCVFCDKQTSGCEDHKCAHMYRRVGGMMLDVHVAILSKPLHICERVVFPSFLASQNGGGGRKQVVSSSMGA